VFSQNRLQHDRIEDSEIHPAIEAASDTENNHLQSETVLENVIIFTCIEDIRILPASVSQINNRGIFPLY